MLTNRTWKDIEERALHCPVMQALVAVVREGADREQALINTVLWLSSDREGQIADRARLMMQVPARIPVRRQCAGHGWYDCAVCKP